MENDSRGTRRALRLDRALHQRVLSGQKAVAEADAARKIRSRAGEMEAATRHASPDQLHLQHRHGQTQAWRFLIHAFFCAKIPNVLVNFSRSPSFWKNIDCVLQYARTEQSNPAVSKNFFNAT